MEVSPDYVDVHGIKPKGKHKPKRKTGLLAIAVTTLIVCIVITLAVLLYFLLTRENGDPDANPDIDTNTNNTNNTSPALYILENPPPSYISGLTSWYTWGEWSSCDVTCGGGIRTRNRTCYSAVQNRECYGDTTQTKTCGEWNCPDCSMTCLVGELDEVCIVCVCNTHSISGTVMDTAGRPLQDVLIYHRDFPITAITSTDQDGHFELSGVCVEDYALLIEKTGFVRETVESPKRKRRQTNEERGVDIVLERIVSPIMDDHPQNKRRLIGSNVKFCCQAHGKPDIQYYEWFKDNKIVKTDYNVTSGGSLILNDVSMDDSGEYKCRANNEVGTAYSVSATLTINDQESTPCNPSPTSRLLKLPDECVVNGNQYYEVGQCIANKCPGNLADDLACGDEQEYCCGIIDTEQQDVECITFNMTVTIVTKCGCMPCGRQTVKVYGRVRAADDHSLVLNRDLYVDDSNVGKTNEDGTFSFETTKAKRRLCLQIRDKYGIFVDSSRVLPVGQSQATFHEIYLQRKAPPVTFSVSEGSSIPLGLGQDGFAEVQIPDGAFKKSDNTPYEGDVKASITFIDPRDPSATDVIQSDLTTTDVEGQSQELRTYGMFIAKFEDDSNNPLIIDKPMQIVIDTATTNIDLNDVDENGDLRTKLWAMNAATGSWDEIGKLQIVQDRREKRQAGTIVVGDIVPSELDNAIYDWYNIDKFFYGFTKCYLKIRVYEDEALSTPIEGAVVTATTYDLTGKTDPFVYGPGPLAFFDKSVSDQYGSVCLVTLCSRDEHSFFVRVTADSGGSVLTALDPTGSNTLLTIPAGYTTSEWPQDIINTVELPPLGDESGSISMKAITPKMSCDPDIPGECPYNYYYDYDVYYDIYDYDDKSGDDPGPLYWQWIANNIAEGKCNSADKNENHVVFVKKSIGGLYESETEDYDFDKPIHISRNRTVWSWFPLEGGNKRACFIKILVDSPNQERFRVSSYGGGGDPLVGNEPFGFRIDDTKSNGVSAMTAACIEFKCSGPLREGDPEADIPGFGKTVGPDQTVIKVSPSAHSTNCRLKPDSNGFRQGFESLLHNHNLNGSIVIDTIGIHTFTAKMPVGNSNGETTGIYVGEGGGRVGYTKAYENCLDGYDSSGDDIDNPMRGWALQFDCNDN
ncbi:cartilage intermediate layer protein 1-like [Glandiceps talaboti]